MIKHVNFLLQLSNLGTPIHAWQLPGVPEGFSIHIKRDDLTGTELSGNKVTGPTTRYMDPSFSILV